MEVSFLFFYPISTSNHDYRFLLISTKDCNFKVYLDRFINKAGVKANTYAGNLMTKIFGALTENTIDLKKEYQRYYKAEYDSFELFLYNKYLLSQKTIDFLNIMLNEQKTLYFADLVWNVDYNMATLINENEKMVESINDILLGCEE